MDKWKSHRILWPVKAMPITRVLELERQDGSHPLQGVGGFFTCMRSVMSKTPEEMEAILGLGPGYFKSGVSIWRFQQLPTPDQFELKGYTQCPDGENFEGTVLRETGAPRPKYFKKDGTPATFIPGLGVEQWTLKSGIILPAVELERVAVGQQFKQWR